MTMTLKTPGIAASTLTHALGTGVDLLWNAIVQKNSGLHPNPLDWCALDCWIGQVPDVERIQLPEALKDWDCRNHRLAWRALQDQDFRQHLEHQIAKLGAKRIGLVLGTSTSGIQSTEAAYLARSQHGAWPDDFHFAQTHSVDALTNFVTHVLGIQGPAVGVAAACASSAKIFLMAQRWITAGIVDAVVVGGVDSLCLSTLYGFNALQLLSTDICRPFDASRQGISIGEAAGFVLLTKESCPVNLLGGGESSDAYHITSPRPDGLGAQEAIQAALAATGLNTCDIDYINAHGTATPSNDRSEAAALLTLFDACDVPVSSTKGVTGHTLGAAGIVEAIITIQALQQQILPPLANLITPDPDIRLNLVTEARPAQLHFAMSNNFGFGGTNCALIFGRDH